MKSGIEVEISSTQFNLRVDVAALDQLVRLVLAAEARPRGSVSIALVDNATIHTINRTYLGHDWPTDVITFPLSEIDDLFLTGELVVSAEMACMTALEIGVEPDEELALYVVHGLLHLCGYDDHDDGDRQRMREREDELLKRAGLKNPYARDRALLPELPDSQERQAATVLSGIEGVQTAAESLIVSHHREGRPWTP